MGFNYHGGHTNTPWPAIFGTNTWISPQRLTDRSSLVLISDMNDWSPGYGQTFAPHAKNGPILQGTDASNPDAGGASSAAVGAVGGNIGLLVVEENQEHASIAAPNDGVIMDVGRCGDHNLKNAIAFSRRIFTVSRWASSTER